MASRARSLVVVGLLVLGLLALGGAGAWLAPRLHVHREADSPGRLVIAMPTISEGTFLPWNGSTGRKFYLDTIYEYLAYLDPRTLTPQPGLAERWDMSPDGKTYSLFIRKHVAFQHGWGELTAQDVKYTLDRIRDPRAIAGPSSPLRKLIARVEAPERYKVVVTLAVPDIDFIRGYLSNGLVVPIVCKRYLEQKGDRFANTHPVGTGAFVLTGYRQDASITVRVAKAATAHWRVSPQFREIVFISAPEEFTRAAMLKAGEVDLAPIHYDSIQAIRNSGLRLIFVENNWAPVIRLGGLSPRFRNDAVPWAKQKVRQALNYAIDKQTLVDTIFHGHARAAGADAPAPEWLDLPPYAYDPDRARALLSSAGYRNGFDITLRTYATTPGAELPILADAVALYWRAVGVRASIVPTHWTSLRGAWTSGHTRDIGWMHRGLPFASTLAGLQASVMSASVFSSYANAETDARVASIGAALSLSQRAGRVRALGEYLRDEAAAVFLVFASEPYGASAKVGSWPALSQQGTNVDLITRAR